MKQTFPFGVLLVFVFATAFINPLQSQDLKKREWMTW